MKKNCESLREHTIRITNFEKKNDTIDKRRIWIIISSNKPSHLPIKNPKTNSLMMKNIKELETITFILVNIEVLYIAYVINIPKEIVFTADQNVVIILS